MLRALLLLLLIANALFFAWSRGALAPGWPPPGRGDREPARLAAQLRPESVVVVPMAKAASAARASASAAAARPVCLEAGPLSDADIGPAVAALNDAGLPEGSWQREQIERPGTWAIYFGRFADTAAMRAKEEELARLKLALQPATAPPDLVPGLMLAPLADREAADAALAALALRGVRTARVVPLPAPPLQHWLRVPQADAELQARLAALNTSPALASVPGAGFIACVKAP
jgi:hypothetical protein